MISNNNNIHSINDWVDFWFYERGVNVIPTHTIEKKTSKNWSPGQDKPIPVEGE